MDKRVLITGGAGFIGSPLADQLLADGHEVRALDKLTPQVHGTDRQRPAYLQRDVELAYGDVRDPRTVPRALEGVSTLVRRPVERDPDRPSRLPSPNLLPSLRSMHCRRSTKSAWRASPHAF